MPCPITRACRQKRGLKNQERFMAEDGVVMVATIAVWYGH